MTVSTFMDITMWPLFLRKWWALMATILAWSGCATSANIVSTIPTVYNHYEYISTKDIWLKLSPPTLWVILTNKHSVFVWMSGILYNWDNVGPFLCYIDQISTTSVWKFNCIHQTILKKRHTLNFHYWYKMCPTY